MSQNRGEENEATETLSGSPSRRQLDDAAAVFCEGTEDSWIVAALDNVVGWRQVRGISLMITMTTTHAAEKDPSPKFGFTAVLLSALSSQLSTESSRSITPAATSADASAAIR